MKAWEFIQGHCKKCGFFDKEVGCNAAVECDEAWNAPVDVYGKTMRERVGEFCSSKHGANSCCVGRVDYKFIDDETVDDIIMQIWNDGGEGIVYSDSDIQDFKRRLNAAIRRNKKTKKEGHN